MLILISFDSCRHYVYFDVKISNFGHDLLNMVTMKQVSCDLNRKNSLYENWWSAVLSYKKWQQNNKKKIESNKARFASNFILRQRCRVWVTHINFNQATLFIILIIYLTYLTSRSCSNNINRPKEKTMLKSYSMYSNASLFLTCN